MNSGLEESRQAGKFFDGEGLPRVVKSASVADFRAILNS